MDDIKKKQRADNFQSFEIIFFIWLLTIGVTFTDTPPYVIALCLTGGIAFSQARANTRGTSKEKTDA